MTPKFAQEFAQGDMQVPPQEEANVKHMVSDELPIVLDDDIFGAPEAD